VVEALRHASHRALEAGIDAAISKELDAVLIAGDLFDSERLSVQTERFLMEALARLGAAGIPVVYATGNHDPGDAAGARTRLRWPEHVHVLDRPWPSRVEILRDGTPVGAVTGVGHPDGQVGDDLSSRFPTPDGRLPEVALLHTQVVGARGAEAHARYAPSELVHLKASGYAYWALGHVHVRQILSSDPPIHYPGNPQGRNPRETGAKGGLVVDLTSARDPEVTFLELGSVRWERLVLDDLGSLDRPAALADAIEAAWSHAREDDAGLPGGQWIPRVELVGPSPLYRELSTPGVLEELRDALGSTLGVLELEILRGGLRPIRRVEAHLHRTDVLGEVLRLVRDLADPGGGSPSGTLGISSAELAGLRGADPAELDAYLRTLLDGADVELLDALLEDPVR